MSIENGRGSKCGGDGGGGRRTFSGRRRLLDLLVILHVHVYAHVFLTASVMVMFMAGVGVEADDMSTSATSPLLEKRAKFVLDTRRRRRRLFEVSVRRHYENKNEHVNKDNDHNLAKQQQQQRQEVSADETATIKKTSSCLYYTNTADNKKTKPSLSQWTYEICPNDQVRRMKLVPLTSASLHSEYSPYNPSPTSKIGRVEFSDGKKYNIQDVERLGRYSNSEQFHDRQQFDDMLTSLWGSQEVKMNVNVDAKRSSSSPNTKKSPYSDHHATGDGRPALPVQYYVGGSVCVDEPSKFNAAKLITQDCCQTEPQTQESMSTSTLAKKVVNVVEENPCRFVINLCIMCLEDGKMPNEDEDQDEDENVSSISPAMAAEEEKLSSSIPKEQPKPAGPSIMENFLLESDINYQKKGKGGALVYNPPSWLNSLQESLPGIPFPPMPHSILRSNLDRIKSMFMHAYDSYMYHAYPAGSEIKPLSCKPGLFHLVRLPALTLIDALDTLIILGNHTEFARSVERLRVLDDTMRSNQPWTNSLEKGGIFAVDQNVSVFETNIRVLGGLLSAHQMAEIWMEDKVSLDDVFHSDSGDVLMGETTKESDILDTMSCPFEDSNGEDIDKMHPCTDQKGSGGEATSTCAPARSVDDAMGRSETTSTSSHKLNENEKFCAKNATKTRTSSSASTTQYWKYDGFLLNLAEDMGKRLLPAFKTPTGIPYGTINLLYGIPEGETTIASLAGGGTLSIEMELLSRLVNNDVYGKAAKLSTRALWSRRSKLDLLGKHINVDSGIWTEQTSGIGSNSDSFYEYLIKHHILFPEDEDFFTMFNNTYSGVYRNGKLGDWYPDVPMQSGLSAPITVFESLASFFPGMQVLLGELNAAARSTNSFTVAREYLDFLPERFDFSRFDAVRNHALYPLRPELYESTYFLHLATKDFGKRDTSSSAWLWSADFFLDALEKLTKVECGFCSVSSISPKNQRLQLMDDMPSYFLSETLKYLYLTFDTDNPINTDKERNWVFTTEAHPVHSVPRTVHTKKTSSEEEKWLDDSADKVLGLLNDLLKFKSKPSNAGPIPKSPHRPVRYLQQEKWSQQTSKYMHVKDLNTAVNAVHTNIKDRHEKVIFGRLMNVPKKVVELDAREDDYVNFAYLEHSLHGRGMTLSKSCPNYHHSNALWTNAFAGDDLNYAESFESNTSNENIMTKMKHHLPSALTASALLGTSYFSTKSPRCINYQKKANGSNPSGNDPPPGTQRVDMGGELGSFDVQMHPEGAGFYVRHERTGESIEVTIADPQDSLSSGHSDNFVAVDSYIPIEVGGNKKTFLDRSIDSSISILKSMFTLNGPSPFKIGRQRNVIIADMNGHSFECKVELKAKVALGADEEGLDQNFKLIDSFPCLPATFGPTQMKSLLSAGNDGVTFESVAHKPDPFSCDSAENMDDNNESESGDENEFETYIPPSIQLVRRGQCNFVEKGLYASKTKNAKAVIVINNDERGLFIMAGSPAPKHLMAEEEPISVLVSKLDGDQMIKLMKQYEEESTSGTSLSVDLITNVSIMPLASQIRTTKESSEFSSTTNASSSMKWPMVVTAPDAVQVYASGGWGVGVQQVNSIWQVVLLQHSFHTNTSSGAMP